MKRNELKKLELNYYEEKLVVSSLRNVMRDGYNNGNELLVHNVQNLLSKLEKNN